MKKQFHTLSILSALMMITGCKQAEEAKQHIPTAPQTEARIDRSEPVKIVDVEQASQKPEPLKLSQIASKIEYYTVGDARFTVTQAIELSDSNAFITFNNPRIYYRKQGIPSKRYGFKALAYKWNNEMNGQNMFYDKKTTRMYVALSGKTQETRRTGTDSIPFIGVLPPLDTKAPSRNTSSAGVAIGCSASPPPATLCAATEKRQENRTESRHSTSKAIHSASSG